MKVTDDAISRAASEMGRRGWKARVKKYGLKKLQEHMRGVGKNATGRPKLPEDQVKPGTLYQRERRARLKAEQKTKKRKGQTMNL
jgi:hypothetical protein